MTNAETLRACIRQIVVGAITNAAVVPRAAMSLIPAVSVTFAVIRVVVTGGVLAAVLGGMREWHRILVVACAPYCYLAHNK
jgi:hypothetical protein